MVTLSRSARRGLGLLMTLDVIVVAWMLAAGDWLDRTSPLTSVVTLGGHHEVVMGLAAGSFVVLLLTAVQSAGFQAAGRVVLGMTLLAAGTSVVAFGGMLACGVLAVTAVALTAVLARALSR